jgi:dUTP pyrophosphatase
MEALKFVKIRDVKSPSRGTENSAGIDFYVPNDFIPENPICDYISMQPGEGVIIESGIHVKIPKGYVLIAKNRSSIAVSKSLFVGACVIDEDYQGEILLHVINVGERATYIQSGEKIIQMLLLPAYYVEIDEIDNLQNLYDEKTNRGEGCLGSTGTH